MNRIERQVERQFAVIAGGTDEIVPEAGLRQLLRRSVEDGRPLRVKYGIDPTAPNLHIGHLVPCRKLREFQDLGHTAVLVIGDYTARIGDPTGRNEERRALSDVQVAENMRLYADQLFSVVDASKAEVHYQSTWLDEIRLNDMLHLLSRFSAAQMLAHDTFRQRMDKGERLSLHELVYPVLQAYDSIRIEADVEIGGSDQKFNCLCGRDLQRALGLEPQVVVTVPLLPGNDGRKMSKSFDNHIAIRASATEMVGRVMSIPDELLEQYAQFATSWDGEKRQALLTAYRSGTEHPRSLKMKIAADIAAQFHGPDESKSAVKEFDRVFARRELPSRIQTLTVRRSPIGIIDLLLEGDCANSRSEARRLVEQGGVRIDDEVILSSEAAIGVDPGERRLLRVGKRRFFELTADTHSP